MAPHLRMMQKSMATYKIASLVNNLSVSNIRSTAEKLANHDLIADKNRFCRTVIKCQSRFPRTTNVYASLASIVNSNFPDVGLLLVKMVALNFKAGFDSKDKEKMRRASKLLAHLVNQSVVCEALAVEVMLLLLGDPTPDNVDVATEFCMECAPHLLREFFMEFRGVLKREHVRVRKSGFRRYPREDGLDLVAVGDQVTHEVWLHDIRLEESLDDELIKDGLGIEKGFSRMMIGESESDEVTSRFGRMMIGGESDHEMGG